MSNHCVQAFAGGLPGGRLELPRMDDWTLGVWQDNSVINSAPVSGSRLDPSRPLLSQVHTVLLIDDSESMLERGSGGWGGNGQSGATRWDQVPGDEGILFASLEEHVTRIVQRGHPAHQMGIEFLQVGDCRWATAHLYEIEEVVSQHHKSLNRDVVGVTPVGYMQQHRMNGATLMQVILSGIDARVNGYLRQRRINV
ncbi:hypothetical protein WJX79_004426 [Trebouxia sp. C0005]